jgi:hypothetical protein
LVLVAGDQAAQSTPLPSVQLMFVNAAGAAAKNDWSGALDGYAAIEKRLVGCEKGRMPPTKPPFAGSDQSVESRSTFMPSQRRHHGR